jgi:hypothetical protein
MGIEAETITAFFRAVAETYGDRTLMRPRHLCEREGRCVYDDRCPLIDSCTPTDYSE